MTDKVRSVPYYAVIFTSQLTQENEGYEEMAEQMVALAKAQVGFLGMDTARSALGITISYWESLEAISSWKQHSAHMMAQEKGKNTWYQQYEVKICKVEREYSFNSLR